MKELIKELLWLALGALFVASCILPALIICLAAVIGGHMERE